ncbi:hypothetical protein N24_2829 [Corynebacterium suranareeae]|uniref:Uncharacterized protein n=1 Tax=Corynebacterium suranareeae TaxID=2506452 RepID=A0A160PV68_9CORY|nr:hypothetical protein N24_2829 [Corynebacterium suranareeae]
MSSRRKTTDALYSDRVKLLRDNPEQYFKNFPKPEFGFLQTRKNSTTPKSSK